VIDRKDSAYFTPWRSKIGGSETVLFGALLIVPIVIGLVWGVYLDDSAYVTFGHARDLATGRGLPYHLIAEGQQLLRAPLYALVLWLPARSGVPLPQVGLLLGVLGWGAVAVAVYSVSRVMRRAMAAVVSAALVAFGPLIVSTLGTEVSWVVALAWVALAASMKKRWDVQAGASVLMVCVHFDWVTLATAMALLVVRWIETERFPLRFGLVLAIAVSGWELLAAWRVVAPFSSPHWGLAGWGRDVRRLLKESEFYWLSLPLSACGLCGVLPKTQSAWRVGLLCGVWIVASILIGGAVAGAMVGTVGLMLVGVGVEVVSLKAIQWIGKHNVVRVGPGMLMTSLALVAGLPLGVAQVSSLTWRYQFRPVVRQELEREAGEWLRVHSEPGTTVFGSQRVGYLADRATFPWDGKESDPAELAKRLGPLTENPPDYCVSFKSIAWDYVMRTGWFRHGYAPLQEFESAYDATSPLTIWGYRPDGFDLAERQQLNVRLPGGVDLIGYRYGPEHIQGGGTVHVTLFLRAAQPITRAFQTAVVMSMPQEVGDEVHWRHVDMYGDRSVPVGWWQVGQVVSERFVLEISEDIPVGAYRLDVSVLASDSTTHLPMYQNGDTSPLDRVFLGYVAVPWKGEMDIAQAVDANLGDEIGLLGFEVADDLSPGSDFDVVLYWEARRPPEENYVVFVHLLDAEGQIVANHDGSPMQARYPTRAWLPGDIVRDVHRLVLDSSVPVGEYQLKVGMYRWPDLDRLPVWDSQGVEQADRAFVLQSVRVQ
jgi:hypothetical protein